MLFLGQSRGFTISNSERYPNFDRDQQQILWKEIPNSHQQGESTTLSQLSSMAQSSVQINSDISLIYFSYWTWKWHGEIKRKLCSVQAVLEISISLLPLSFCHSTKAHASESCHKDSSPLILQNNPQLLISVWDLFCFDLFLQYFCSATVGDFFSAGLQEKRVLTLWPWLWRVYTVIDCVH